MIGVVWQIAPRAGLINRRIRSGPGDTLLAGSDLTASGRVWPHLWVSLQEFASGFVLAVVIVSCSVL